MRDALVRVDVGVRAREKIAPEREERCPKADPQRPSCWYLLLRLLKQSLPAGPSTTRKLIAGGLTSRLSRINAGF